MLYVAVSERQHISSTRLIDWAWFNVCTNTI